jgi:4-hydroxy-tetrahydrodipicolinate reductase
MRIALIGYGKMGRSIEEVALARHHEIDEVIGTRQKDHLNDLLTPEVDVAIEFTTPDAAAENISVCLEKNIPVVSGTTGWLHDFDRITKLTTEKNGAFFYASNFSIGMNILFALNRYLGKIMAERPEYDSKIKETHHTHKIDSPSGTAITLAEDLLKLLPGKTAWVDHKTEEAHLLPILSVREGEIPGTHEIHYTSLNDTIKIAHVAHNRIGFAEGAVLAAEWVKDKKGVFGMKDLLTIV